MRIVVAPSSAVPLSEIAHDGISGVVAMPLADHVMVVPLSVPPAVPETVRPPAQVALKAPTAAVADCCVGVHTKFVQLDGDGMMFVDADFQVPASASAVVDVGLLGVVVLVSYPTHPAAAAATAQANMQCRCFIGPGAFAGEARIIP